MKKVILNTLAITIMVGLTACSGNDSNEDTAPSLTVNMAAEASKQLVTFDALSEQIESARSMAEWLGVSIAPYTNGSPMLRLNVTANLESIERRTKVLVATISKSKMELIVVQKGKAPAKPEGTSIEDAHSSVTDQPAYIPHF